MRNGYWEFPRTISAEDAKNVSLAIDRAETGGATLKVREGVRFISFDPATTPDAICCYCWSANLHTSTHCEKCGAPLIR